MKPSAYFIEYQDSNKWTPELQEHDIAATLARLDTRTLADARKEAAIIGVAHNSHVQIYRRANLKQIEPPYGPWCWDAEYVEDGR